MKTFIRAIEVWVPSTDRSILEFGGGLYGSATRFAALSKTLCFGRGEGLPGQAWEQGRPIILKRFDGSYFRRTAAAHAEGITCGIAVPIFAGDFLTSVLVMFCGDDEAHAGAIELWHNDPEASADMTLVDGYYGSTADTFEFMSKRTSFRRGSGLPGLAWEAGAPVFFEDLGKASRFLRADTAVKVGINRGYAIPCPIRKNEHYVMTFLSALNTPIARRFEIWVPDAARERLVFNGGFCEAGGVLRAAPHGPSIEPGHGTIGRAFLNGVPAVTDDAAAEPGGLGAAAAESGLAALAAVPVIGEGRLAAVVAWYF
ncbi:MAG TPA: GAF domain-containing protein [Burkholderiaceae bacterium]|nr:GAF domain-containing protein [Burkholderiaceae bacterium]